MAITVVNSNAETVNITEDGVSKTVPRVFNNPTYQEIIGKIYQDIKRNGTQYIAFPFVQKIGNYIFVVFSEGESHGDSDRQKVARKAIADITSQSLAWDIATFYENDTGVYDLSLFSVMNDGDVAVFKAWVVSKAAGTVSAQIVSTATVSGYSDATIDGTYALWSTPRYYATKWYRTGYRVASSTEWNTVLFESTDLVAWSIKGVLAKGTGAAKEYNEADIVETTAGNYLAVIREDSGSGRPLYTSTSSDLITWSAPALSSAIEGTQPNLIKLASSTILLGVGDRVDRSGFDAGGLIPNAIDTTGIELYKLPSPYSTWGAGVSIDKTWSTDGGQPMQVEYSAGNVFCAYYNSLQPTDSITEPGVRCKAFNEGNIV